MIIDGSKVVCFCYASGSQQFRGTSDEEAAALFEDWVKRYTPYRSWLQFAKHRGYEHIFFTEDGHRFSPAGGTGYYELDQNGVIIRRFDYAETVEA